MQHGPDSKVLIIELAIFYSSCGWWRHVQAVVQNEIRENRSDCWYAVQRQVKYKDTASNTISSGQRT